jgi:hypothetical protein
VCLFPLPSSIPPPPHARMLTCLSPLSYDVYHCHDSFEDANTTHTTTHPPTPLSNPSHCIALHCLAARARPRITITTVVLGFGRLRTRTGTSLSTTTPSRFASRTA